MKDGYIENYFLSMRSLYAPEVKEETNEIDHEDSNIWRLGYGGGDD